MASVNWTKLLMITLNLNAVCMLEKQWNNNRVWLCFCILLCNCWHLATSVWINSSMIIKYTTNCPQSSKYWWLLCKQTLFFKYLKKLHSFWGKAFLARKLKIIIQIVEVKAGRSSNVSLTPHNLWNSSTSSYT